MTTEQDRIRLAEAMGLESTEFNGKTVFCCKDSRYVGGYSDWDDFDPFTDANDDYAVLEWMRGGEPIDNPMWKALRKGPFVCYHYRIGDYARAALEVIDAST